MSPETLLAHAQHLTHARTDAEAWPRAAALLARMALERAARRALNQKYTVEPEASFRSQLLALRAVAGEDLAHQAAYTWTALSQATHHYSYAMPPTSAELERWIAVVARVVAL